LRQWSIWFTQFKLSNIQLGSWDHDNFMKTHQNKLWRFIIDQPNIKGKNWKKNIKLKKGQKIPKSTQVNLPKLATQIMRSR